MAYEKINAEIIPEGFEIHPNFQNLEPEMKVAVMSGIKGDKGDKGDTGQNGRDGQDGQDGAAATITVGTVTTGTPSTPASVTNVGTSTAAVFDFVIPKGDKGDPGSGGGGATGFNINFTYEDDEWSCDQTYSDLIDAIGDGEIINAVISIGGVDHEGQFLYDSNNDFVIFTYVLDENMFGWVKLDYDGLFDDGSFSVPTDTSDLTNTAGFITSSDIPVTSVNNQTGDVTISVPANTSDLNNDSGFITSSDIPVTSVNSKTGAVSLTATDVGALSSSTHIPNVPDFFYIAFTYSNGTLTASESFVDIANAIADGLFADALLTYGTDTYRLNAIWDDDGQAVVYIKFVTADGKYTITYTSTTLTIEEITNPQIPVNVIFITNASAPYGIACNKTAEEIGDLVDLGTPINAQYIDTSGTNNVVTSLNYSVVLSSDSATPYFWGVDSSGNEIRFVVYDYVMPSNEPYFAKPSDIPTKVSQLQNDSGFITSAPAKTVWYGTCTTGEGTATKVVTTSTGDFSLTTGNTVIVKFSNGNTVSTASNLKLKVDGLDAKNIFTTSSNYGISGEWQGGQILELTYEGSAFYIVGRGHASTTYYGVTALSSSTSSNAENVAATPKAVKTVMDAIPTVPTNVSAFTNDAGYLTSAPVTSVNSQTGAVTLSIPSATSDLTNDSGYITSSALSGYVASSATSTIFVQDSAPVSSSNGDIWIDTSQDSIPSANGEEF